MADGEGSDPPRGISPEPGQLHHGTSMARLGLGLHEPSMMVEDRNSNGIPDILETDDWSPLEAWKPGDFAVILTNRAKVEAAFERSGIHVGDDFFTHLGAVGQVVQVGADNILQVTLREDEGVTLHVPMSAVKKIMVIDFMKPAHQTPEESGILFRETRLGGLQLLGVEQESMAAKAGLGEHFGWWVTHLGKTPLWTQHDWTVNEGSEIRLEKRATLPFAFALHSLEEKVEGATLASDLRVYILFVVFFIIFFLLDRDVEAAYYVTQNMRGPVLGNEIPFLWGDSSGIGCEAGYGTSPVRWEKTFMDLANVGDWNAWVITMALPALWTDDQFGKSVSSNILLGGIRFRTIRMRNDSCTVNEDIIPNTPALSDEQVCYSVYDEDEESKGGLGESPLYLQHFDQKPPEFDPVNYTTYQTCSDINGPEASFNPPLTSGQISFYHCGGYTFDIPFYHSDGTPVTEEEAQDFYRKRACFGFVDDTATRLVTMELMEYSPTFDTFLSTRMIFEVAAGGAWIPSDQFRTFVVWTDARTGQTVFDCFFILFIFYYMGDFVADARRQYKRKGALLKHILQAWTLLEFVNLLLFLAAYGFRFAWYSRSAEAKIYIEDIQKAPRYPADLDQIEWLYMMQVYFNSCNVVLTFLKLLKFLRLNKRMNILTATLEDCQDSIIGVLVIFVLVVLAFAVTGNTLFGTQMYEFRSLNVSFSTLMRMLMGEFDYEAMKRENRVLAGLFFWGFIVLGLFILLNFLIGVIGESFGNVSGRTVAEPLDQLVDKTKKDLKALCSKELVSKYFRMRFQRCVSREALLERCIDVVNMWRDQEYQQVVGASGELEYKEDEGEENQIITKQEFLACIKEANDGMIMEDLGEEYIIYIWNHLLYEFNRSQEAEQLQHIIRRQAAFERGCKQALAEKLRIIEQFSNRMENLKMTLDHMRRLLDEPEA